jgi:flagellar basal-body rod protein FlgB
MPDPLSFENTFFALEKAIDIAQQRHTTIASNISNLETPYYKAKEIDFKSTLAQALQSNHGVRLVRTNPGHIDSGEEPMGEVEAIEEEGKWNGFNWVDIDTEMAKLMENNLIYRTTIEAMLRKIALIKEVITEGGR